MNEDLRNALDRAAGGEPRLDLTEAAWAKGRTVRRRRHVAQAVGGVAATMALVGAFAIGGGVLNSPQGFDGPASPTLDDGAVATGPVVVDDVEEPTTQEPATEDATTEEEAADEVTTDAPDAQETGSDSIPGEQGDGLVLTATSIDGLALTTPTEDLVAAVTARLGEPINAQTDVVGGCGGDEVFSLYNWDGFLLHVEGADGPDAVRSWEVHDPDAVLPNGVRVGMTEAELRAVETLTEIPSVNSQRYELGSGIMVWVDAEGMVSGAASRVGEIC